MKVFIDLDGTISEYWHSSGKINLKGKYDKGMFINKLPIKSVIREISIRYKKDEKIILSASPNKEATEEKKEWVRKHIKPYMEIEEEIYIDYNSEDKVEYLEAYTKEKGIEARNCILIDDHHEYLKRAEEIGMQVYHPSRLVALNEEREKKGEERDDK